MINVNYWNMMNYQPFFNKDSKGMEQLQKDIGCKAAIVIQTVWRKFKSNGLKK